MTPEKHPLEPFLPTNATLLMLGSFPPPQKRWCMDFYYPNFNNDMWRIFGLLFFDDKNHFVDTVNKTFRKKEIVDFLTQQGIGIYDTATEVIREKDNASDKFLQVVKPTNIKALLQQMPQCRTVVTTGQKATDTLCEYFGIAAPAVGHFTAFEYQGSPMRFYRMPSSSRAYTLALEKKADFYKNLFFP